MPLNKEEAVQAIQAFAALPASVQKRIAAASGLQRIGAGSTLFREGDRADFVYALVEGHVALVSGADAGDTIADFMDAGDIVLIAPALLGQPYVVTGRATVDVLALLIPAETFRSILKTETSFAEAIAVTLARHWRLLLGQLKQVKTQDADARLAQFFLDKSGKAKGRASVTLTSSKRQLAAHLGITPETLSRSLRRLRGAGVRSQGKSISIPSIERLAAFTDLPTARESPKEKKL